MTLIGKLLPHRLLYIGGLLMIAVGLPVSPMLMSVGQFVIMINWLLEGNYQEKWERIRNYKTGILFLVGIYAIHLLGLIYTSDWVYALKDLRIKLPLFVMPLVIGSSALLRKKDIDLLLVAFLSCVTLTTLVSMATYLGWVDIPIKEIRDISIFISHIRFSLMIALSIFILIHYIRIIGIWKTDIQHFSIYALTLWLGIFLGVLGARIGLLVTLVTALYMVVYFAIKLRKYLLASAILLVVLVMPVAGYFAIDTVQIRVNETIEEIEMHQAGGNPDGYSILQRFTYWNIALELIEEHPVIGVGTGDVNKAFHEYYDSNETGLQRINKLRSHNQYLSIAVAFGLIGLILFLISMFAPAYFNRKKMDLLLVLFLVIAAMSMLTEDTLETQVGVTFFIYFYCILLYREPSALFLPERMEK